MAEDCGGGLWRRFVVNASTCHPCARTLVYLCDQYAPRVYGRGFTGGVYGRGLRADIAVRNAYPLFTGKNDPHLSDTCP